MILEFNVFSWLTGLALLAGLLVVLRYKGRSLSYLLCFSLFWFYLLMVIRWTIFPIYIDPMRAEGMRGHFMDSVNLIPFYFGPFTPFEFALSGLVLNILLTMPAGFGISFVTRFRPVDLVWLVAVFGAGIEGLQLFISLLLGYPYRTIDINDVLCNSLGALLGYFLFVLFARLYAAASRRWNLQHRGLFRYVFEVVSGL